MRQSLQRKLTSGEALSLDQLLPDPDQQAAQPQTETRLRQRSAWSSTFVASLELAKQGDVARAQAENFDPIIAYSDEAGHAYRYDAGHLFRYEAGHRSDLKPAI